MENSKPNYHGIDHFFKYCTAETAKLIIKNKCTQWSSPLLFNDPFDLQTDLMFDFDLKCLGQAVVREAVDMIFSDKAPKGDTANKLFEIIMKTRSNREKFTKKDYIEKMAPMAEEMSAQAVTNIGFLQEQWIKNVPRFRVYCVSEYCDNLLMWAHYSKDHTGVVIQQKSIPEKFTQLCKAEPVVYREKPPTIAGLEEYVKHLTSQKELDFDNIFLDMITTKSDYWAYENEWRCYYTVKEATNSQKSLVSIIPEEIEAIYFGCQMKEEDQRDIMALLTDDFSHVKKFKAHRHKERYELFFTPV